MNPPVAEGTNFQPGSEYPDKSTLEWHASIYHLRIVGSNGVIYRVINSSKRRWMVICIHQHIENERVRRSNKRITLAYQFATDDAVNMLIEPPTLQVKRCVCEFCIYASMNSRGRFVVR